MYTVLAFQKCTLHRKENKMNTAALKAEMVRKNVSRKELADHLGISIPTINAKINGHRDFTCSEAAEIVKYLEIENPLPIFF